MDEANPYLIKIPIGETRKSIAEEYENVKREYLIEKKLWIGEKVSLDDLIWIIGRKNEEIERLKESNQEMIDKIRKAKNELNA